MCPETTWGTWTMSRFQTPSCNGGQPTSGVNFYHKRLDLYEKKAMRQNHINVYSNLYLSLGYFDKFSCPDLMTYMIKVRSKESIQTRLKLERLKGRFML